MVGGLLNLLFQSNEDTILIGNVDKSFFKKTFVAHNNFGKQKFRIDFEGSTKLNYTSPSIYNFNIPRYGDLLQEVYFSFTLPNIWSPLISFGGTTALFCSACRTNITTQMEEFDEISPINLSDGVNTYFANQGECIKCSNCDCSCNTAYSIYNLTLDSSDIKVRNETPTPGGMKWINRIYPLEFKWIENIGVQAIKSIKMYANNNVIQEFTGQYLLNMVYRDFSENQKKIFNRMIGNTNDLIDPANYSNRNGNYPNAAYFGNLDKMAYGLEPSIRSRQLYIPINLWSTLNNKTPIPLISMQYSELRIEVEMRPVNEWWVIKNVINELTIQSANDNLKYNSSVRESTPIDNERTYEPAEESINLVEIKNSVNAFYQFEADKLANPPTNNIIYNESIPDPATNIVLGAENFGIPLDNQLNINKDVASWYVQSQLAAPDSVVAKQLQIASVIPVLYTAPNCSRDIYNLRYFLKEPPPKIITNKKQDPIGSHIKEIGALPFPLDANEVIKKYYEEVPQQWFADVHLIGNYTFLPENERNDLANKCQSYLIREVHEQTIYDLLGGDNYTTIQTQGLVISWMWFFQRSDVKFRNEWSNYSNLLYKNDESLATSINGLTNPYSIPQIYDGALLPNNGRLNNIVWQTEYSIQNSEDILLSWGLYFNSLVRENELDASIVSWVDRYSRSNGSGLNNVFYYNFCLNTDPLVYQPSGAVNLSRINNVNWSYKLSDPPLKKNILPNTKPPWNIFSDIEDPFLNATPIGPFLSNRITASVTCNNELKNNAVTTSIRLIEKYVFSYNLHIMEERYNIFQIENGIAGLVLTRTK